MKYNDIRDLCPPEMFECIFNEDGEDLRLTQLEMAAGYLAAVAVEKAAGQ